MTQLGRFYKKGSAEAEPQEYSGSRAGLFGAFQSLQSGLKFLNDLLLL
jgi:hypothetical protein